MQASAEIAIQFSDIKIFFIYIYIYIYILVLSND